MDTFIFMLRLLLNTFFFAATKIVKKYENFVRLKNFE